MTALDAGRAAPRALGKASATTAAAWLQQLSTCLPSLSDGTDTRGVVDVVAGAPPCVTLLYAGNHVLRQDSVNKLIRRPTLLLHGLIRTLLVLDLLCRSLEIHCSAGV